MHFIKISRLNTYLFLGVMVIFSCVSVFGEKMENNSYVLATGKTGAKALDLQQELIAQGSYNLLQKAGLKAGMVVYDVGCGSGAMTVYLAQQVGSKGRVYAIDVSEEQLDVAKQKVKEAGLSNVTFVQADVQSLEQLPNEVADIIYFRFVLVHLQKPMMALENMYQRLKVGGQLVFQEPTWSTIHTNYPKEFLNQYRDAVINLGQRKGLDYNIGQSTPEMSRTLSNSFVESYELENKITLQQYKELAEMRLCEMGDKLISEGLITEATLLNWKKEIESLPIEDRKYFVNLGNLTCVLVGKRKDN
ncbi:MAG: methyltransferase domain-containing protein [Alphaproteobacteria bacterium]|nr:methyltransferase domain-containing protein [Alphaproteobacteria bacterium]